MDDADEQQQQVDHDRLVAMHLLGIVGVGDHVHEESARRHVGPLVGTGVVDADRDAGRTHANQQQDQQGAVDPSQLTVDDPEKEARGDGEGEPHCHLRSREAVGRVPRLDDGAGPKGEADRDQLRMLRRRRSSVDGRFGEIDGLLSFRRVVGGLERAEHLSLLRTRGAETRAQLVRFAPPSRHRSAAQGVRSLPQHDEPADQNEDDDRRRRDIARAGHGNPRPRRLRVLGRQHRRERVARGLAAPAQRDSQAVVAEQALVLVERRPERLRVDPLLDPEAQVRAVVVVLDADSLCVGRQRHTVDVEHQAAHFLLGGRHPVVVVARHHQLELAGTHQDRVARRVVRLVAADRLLLLLLDPGVGGGAGKPLEPRLIANQHAFDSQGGHAGRGRGRSGRTRARRAGGG